MRVCVRCGAAVDGAWSCPRCRFAPSNDDGILTFAPALAAGNPEDADYGYDELDAAEARHFWFVNRARLVAWALRTYFPRASSMFDVGCGTGGVLAALRVELPGLQLAGGDALLSGLAFARRRAPDVAFVQVDVRRLPYDREFDVVGAFDVLEHLDDDEEALRQMHRAAKPGGGAIVTVPQHRFLWSALDEYSHHRRRYRRRDLVAAIRRAGFAVERVTSFMTLSLPAQLASRLRKRSIDTLDAAAEMRIGPAANGFFGALCAIERAAIAAGASFPAGGSLLVVGRRTS